VEPRPPADPRRTELLAARETALCALAALQAPEAAHGDDGDRALVAEQRDFHARRSESLRARVRAIDVALERLAEGTYGRCATCGEAIAAPRLRVKPDAAECLTCAADRERAEASAGARDRTPAPYPVDEELSC
jgi:RNA polymerase-binding protein DksA